MEKLSIRQLVDAAISAKRGLTLVTSSCTTADVVHGKLCVAYAGQFRTLDTRRVLEIDDVVIRIQVGPQLPLVNNVWHV